MVAKAGLTSMSGALCIWWDNQFISKLANDKMFILLWTRSLDDRQEFGFNPKYILFSPYTLLNFFFFEKHQRIGRLIAHKKIHISDFSWKALNPGAIAPCGKICKNFRNNTFCQYAIASTTSQPILSDPEHSSVVTYKATAVSGFANACAP